MPPPTLEIKGWHFSVYGHLKLVNVNAAVYDTLKIISIGCVYIYVCWLSSIRMINILRRTCSLILSRVDHLI